MRYLMKGGYWKNSEDEMLKAAIMKYGLNQWPRISSLIARKSAKQCKARWNEWLDPRIRKTDWTRDEEEKLLHLAKIFPAQWRTIAPLVGRTTYQCIEHYERLLDMAQNREVGENDPRNLRPGEIDPTPEVRPARADPIDMDDDEREMIAEARVRIANVKGKKAKRKARERVIDEARRLAQLQKFRELRNAGIDFIVERKDRKKKKEFSYGDEVPLERKPVEMLYKIKEEDKIDRVDDNVGNINITQLEGERRVDKEDRQKKEDLEKIKRLRKVDLPGRLDLLGKKRSDYIKIDPLNLPEPQLNEKDYREIVKIKMKENEEEKEFRPSDLLLQDTNPVNNTFLPIRTPKPEISIMMSAREASYLRDPTGTEYERSLKSAGKSKITHSNRSIITPNPYKQMLDDINLRSQNEASKRSSHLSFREDDKMSLNSALRSFNSKNNPINSGIDWEEENWHFLNFQSIERSKRLKKLKNRKIKEIFSSLPKPEKEHVLDNEEIDNMIEETKEAIEDYKTDNEIYFGCKVNEQFENTLAYIKKEFGADYTKEPINEDKLREIESFLDNELNRQGV